MRNYDFHQLLSPEDFAHFAGDVVEIKEGISLRITPRGKDGGIDFHDPDYKIMGQVKNYKDSFSQLKSALKEELPKVRKINPERYILVTATTCTDKNKKELVHLFEGYLTEQDILDKEDLNRLLSRDEYHRIEVSYLNLIVPNMGVLMHSLDKVVHKNIYTQTEFELSQIIKKQPSYVPTNVFFIAQEQLNKNQVIIISGEPGVGKTMLGRMLCMNVLNCHPNAQFVKVNSVSELYDIYDEDQSQVYFFDDFWGEIQFNFQVTPEEERKLMNFINHIKTVKNKWLVITTREYILNEGLHKNPKTEKDYISRKFRFELTELGKKDKFDILYQHLRHSSLSFEQLNYVLNNWESLVSHQNYTPRLISTYLLDYKKDDQQSGRKFYANFISYLDSPYTYWEEVLEKLSFENVLLLLLCALEEKQVLLSTLQNQMYEILEQKNMNYSFKENLQILEDTFLVITNQDGSLFVQLKNPSYRDFLLDYLGKNYLKYLPYLLNYTNNIDQCCLIFQSINKENPDRIENRYYKELELKLLHIVEEIPFYQEDFKISILTRCAKNLNISNHSVLSNYILNYIDNIHASLDTVLSDYDDNFMYFSDLVKEVEKSYSLEKYAADFIHFYLIGSYTLEMFFSFLEWDNIFPEKFHEFVDKNKTLIRSYLEEVALNDAFVCQELGDIDGFSSIEEDLYTIEERIHITCSKRVLKKIDQLQDETEQNPEFDTTTDYLNNVEPVKEKSLTEQEKQQIENQVIELVGENPAISYNDLQHKLKAISDVSAKKRMNQLYNNEFSYRNLLWYKNSFDLLEQYFTSNPLSNKEVTFYNNFVEYLRKTCKLSLFDLEKIQALAMILLGQEKVLFTEEECIHFLNTEYDVNLLRSSFFERRGNWYHFIHPYIQYFLCLQFYQRLSSFCSFERLIDLFESNVKHWIKVRYYMETISNLYPMVESLFPTEWMNVVVKQFQKFLHMVKTKDEITIATSMLLPFKLEYTYHWDGSCNGSYYNTFLYDLMDRYFDIDMASYFDYRDEEDSLHRFLDQFVEKQEPFVLNDYLKRKKFQKLLIENGIVDELNDLYHQMKQFILDHTTIESGNIHE